MHVKTKTCDVLAIAFSMVVFLLLSANQTAAGQTEQAAQPERPDFISSKLVFPKDKVFVEIPFEDQGNHIVIDVSINGSGPVKAVVDTGAQGAVLQDSSIAEALKLKPSREIEIRGVGGGGASSKAYVVDNVTFKIGELEVSGDELVVRPPMKGPSAGFGHAMVIGRSLFESCVVEIDWEQQKLRFYDPKSYRYEGKGTVLPLTFDQGGRPYTSASALISSDKSTALKLVVDTGGVHTLLLETGTDPGIKAPEGAQKILLGRGGSGDIMGYVGKIKSFTLGGYTLNDVVTTFPDDSLGTSKGSFGRQGNVGSGLLRRFKVIFDYAHKRMVLEPNRFLNDPFEVKSRSPANSSQPSTERPVGASELRDYVGRYGERTIFLEDGVLFLQRQGGPKLKLVSLSKDEFGLEAIPTARIKFLRENMGKVTELQVLNRDGEWEKSRKDQP